VVQDGFSPSSYGFRPNRSAHQAVAKAQEHIRQGYSFVVAIDLEKFFDRVNHDVLIAMEGVLRFFRSPLAPERPGQMGTPEAVVIRLEAVGARGIP